MLLIFLTNNQTELFDNQIVKNEEGEKTGFIMALKLDYCHFATCIFDTF